LGRLDRRSHRPAQNRAPHIIEAYRYVETGHKKGTVVITLARDECNNGKSFPWQRRFGRIFLFLGIQALFAVGFYAAGRC